MRVHKMILICCMMVFGWAASVSAEAGTGSEPVGMLQYVANNMIAGLKTHKATLKTNPKVVYSLAYKFVVPYADLAEMSRNVLSPQKWSAATPAQRAQFTHEFTTTVIRTYASALTSYDDQTVKFYPVRGGSQGMKTLEVNGQIISSSHDPINVSYRLVHVAGGWKLYDMSVEGVDMLESFRSQFADLLASGSMADLLNTMSRHNSGYSD
jgi:phospholipid transport system substrate-binding protein